MAQTVLLKRSSVAGNVPGSSDLALGEIAVNTADGALYIKKGNNDIVAVADNDILHIDTTNSRIGIGTTSPDSILHVNSGTSDWPIKAQSTDAKAGIILSDNNTANYIMSQTYTLSLGNQPSLHADNLNIKSTGKTGIGTTSPDSRLHVEQAAVEISTTNLDNGTAVGLHVTMPDAAITSGTTPGVAIGLGMNGRARSYLVNTHVGTNKDAADLSIYTESGGTISEQLRVKHDGKVGIGTTSPASNLHIESGTAHNKLSITSTANGGTGYDASIDLLGSAANSEVIINMGINGDADREQIKTYQSAMSFRTNNTERMRIDASGRLGIKTTPSAWTTDYGVIDLNTGGSIYGTTSGVTTASNLYFTGSAWIAKNTGLGTLYAQHSGAHNWYSSASVSAGSAAGLSTKMTLDASGNLGIGTTSPSSLLHISHATAPTFRLSRTGTGQVWIQSIDSSGRFQLTEKASEGGTGYTRFQVDDTGEITFNGAYTFPTADGSANQVLKTDGSGNLTFATVAGASGGTSISDSDGDTKIQVEESSDEDKIRFDTAGVERMIIDASGKVGIGTTTPLSHLHVNKETSGHNTDGITLGKVESNGWIDTNEEMGRLGWAASYGSSFTPAIGAYISAKADANWNGNEAPTRLGFFTAPENSLTPVERLRITKDGNIGIGTTSPDFTLDVNPSGGAYSAGDNIMGVFQSATDHQTALKIKNINTNTTASAPRAALDLDTADHEAGSGARLRAQFVLRSTAASGSGGETSITVPKDLRFFVNNKGTLNESSGEQASSPLVAGTEAMRITDARNVGIGTASPQEKLHVYTTGTSRVEAEGTTGFAAFKATNNSGSYGWYVDDSADKFHLYDFTDNADRITVDGSGKVGIGTSSPSAKLEILSDGSSGTGAEIRLQHANNNSTDVVSTVNFANNAGSVAMIQGGTTGANNSGYISFHTDSTGSSAEHMRIDSAGSVFISSTSDSGSNRHFFQHDGFFRHVRSGQIVGVFDRLSSDGNIVHFRKDGSDVGNIGAKSDDLYIGTGDTGIRFNDGNDQIWPITGAGTSRDNAIDIGNSSVRFKDLHLAGNANIGGNAVITGNLTVNGTSTTLNVATLDVEDKNITLNKGSGDTSSTADGAGITIQDAVNGSTDASLTWNAAGDKFIFSHKLRMFGQFELPDNVKMVAGDGNDLQIYHNGSQSVITHIGSGDLRIDGNSIWIRETDGTNQISAYQGTAKLYKDGTERLATTSTGVTVAGSLKTDRIECLTDSLDAFTFIDFDMDTGGSSGINNLVLGAVNNADFLIDTNNNSTDSAFVFGTNANTMGSATELMRLNESGQLGIGTASPDRQLEVEGQGVLRLNATGSNTDPGIDFNTSSTNDMQIRYRGGTDKLAIYSYGTTTDVVTIQKSNGNVGIGTTAPSKKLHVKGTSDDQIIIDSNSASANSGLFFFENGTNKWEVYHRGADNTFRIYNYNTSTADLVISSSGNVGIGETSPDGKLHIKGGTATGDASHILFENTQGSKVFAIGGGATGVSNNNLFFRNVTDNTRPMVITDAGNVGIGTTTPTSKVHISGTSDGSGSGADAMLHVKQNGSWNGNEPWALYVEGYSYLNGFRINAADGIRSLYKTTSGGTLGFATSDTAPITFTQSNSAEKMRIHSNGNVGIGSTAPAAKLQVEEYGVDTTTTSSTATTQIAIHSFAAATFRSARFTVQVTNSTDSTYHTTELLLVHNGTTANITEFGEIHTGSAVEATFDADINSGNVRLLATPATTDTMAFKVVCHSITT